MKKEHEKYMAAKEESKKEQSIQKQVTFGVENSKEEVEEEEEEAPATKKSVQKGKK